MALETHSPIVPVLPFLSVLRHLWSFCLLVFSEWLNLLQGCLWWCAVLVFFCHVFNCAFHVSADFLLFSSPENALAISVLNMISYLFCHFDRLSECQSFFFLSASLTSIWCLLSFLLHFVDFLKVELLFNNFLFCCIEFFFEILLLMILYSLFQKCYFCFQYLWEYLWWGLSALFLIFNQQ